MQDQLTVSSPVLPSCAQQHPSRRHNHQCTPHTSSSPSRRRCRRCWSLGNFGFKCCRAKCWLRRLRLRRRGGSVHVRALMKGVGYVKRHGKEGSERRLRGDMGFANKANLAHRGGERAAPLPLSPPIPGTAEDGKEGEGGGGAGGGREGFGGREEGV